MVEASPCAGDGERGATIASRGPGRHPGIARASAYCALSNKRLPGTISAGSAGSETVEDQETPFRANERPRDRPLGALVQPPVAVRYQMSEKFEEFAIRNAAGLFDTSPLYKYRFSGRRGGFLRGLLARYPRGPVGRAQVHAVGDDRGFGIGRRAAPRGGLLSAHRADRKSPTFRLSGSRDVTVEECPRSGDRPCRARARGISATWARCGEAQ